MPEWLYPETIATIVTLVITIIGGFGITLTKLKSLLNAVKESSDVVSVIESALADDKLTKDEVDAVIAAINEAKGAWSGVFAKKE